MMCTNMIFIRVLFSVALLAMGTTAQNVMRDLSFGYDKTISPNSFGIPGWMMLGEGFVPQLLSDKVILTPPFGGNKKGALWTEKANSQQDWSVELEFRTNGQERSFGGMSLWYAKDGAKQVSTHSIYTVGAFDGLAVVVDTVGGVQKVRGFLNDGLKDYRSQPSIEGAAFGHCDYNYWNLGRPSKIRLTSTSNGLEVKVDDQFCFGSNKISLPHDYTFGVTASSKDPPDSFEAFRFIVRPESQPSIQQQNTGAGYQQDVLSSMPKSDDTPASQYTSSQSQFEDLHSRLYQLSKSVTTLFQEIQRHTQAEEQRYQEILRKVESQSGSGLESRIANLDRSMSSLEREIKSGDYKGQFDRISKQIAQSHSFTSEHLPNTLRQYVQDHTPRIGFIVFSFIGFQCLLVVAYVLYKRRRASMPKKFL